MVAIYMNTGLIYLAMTKSLVVLIILPLSLIFFLLARELYKDERCF